MKKIKRILALLMALCLVICLVACANDETADTTSRRKKSSSSSSSSNSDGNSSGGTSSGNGENVDDMIAGASADQVALFGDLNGTKLRLAEDAVLEEFEVTFYEQLEQTTGMTIELEPMSSNELMTKISQAVASGDTRNYFDVAVVVNSTILQAIYANLIVPMDQYIDRNDPVWRYSYSDNTDFLAPDVFRIDGKTYGAPSHTFHETFIFYNKTYFQEVGAPDPYEEYYLKDNWTKETFLDTCEAVTKKDANGNVEVAAWASWNYFTFPAAFGNDCIAQNDRNKWEVIIDQPNGMAGLDLLYQCAKNGWLDTKTSGYEEFVNRKIAMIIDKPSSAMGGPDAYQRMSDEIGMVPFPKLDANQENYICPLTISGYAIAACSQNMPGAAAWIYYHRIMEMNRDELYNTTYRHLNQEAQERRAEYLKKCEFSVPMIEGLQGWYSGGARAQFLQKIFREQKNPANIKSELKQIVQDCLRRTTG